MPRSLSSRVVSPRRPVRGPVQSRRLTSPRRRTPLRRAFRVAGLALLLTAVSAVPARADVDPNVERGFSAEKVYSFGEIDQVNLFNGNLMLQLPLGRSYPVNGGLSFGLGLSYNSNVWDFESVPVPSTPPQQAVSARPSRESNAGLGWAVSLGKLYPPNVPVAQTPYWRYLGEDGAEHSFHTTLHSGETSVANVWYSRDGSYLRLRRVTDLAYEVDFPDGTVKRFTRATTGATFHLAQIRDPFGNAVNITTTATRWTIADPHRIHYVNFEYRPATNTDVVTSVDLATFGGARAVYNFAYNDMTISRSCLDKDPATAATVAVTLLSNVTLPDGSKLVANAYNTTCFEGAVQVDNLPGTLEKLTLPTLGQLEWTYQSYLFPTRNLDLQNPQGVNELTSITTPTGVATKRVLTASGGCQLLDGVGCQWTYTPAGLSTSDSRTTTVTHPTNDQSVHHFSQTVTLDVGAASGWQYSLPIHQTTTDGSGRYLSQEVYDGIVGGGGVKKRTVYLRYEHDKLPTSTTKPSLWYATNRRVASEKSVFHDDGGKYAESTSSGFDGLGHYRTTATTGTFGAGDVRSSTTNFNPSRGTYLHNGAAGSTFTPWPTSRKWVLGTYTEASVTEGGVTAKSDLCFENAESDTMTGFLLRRRVMKATSAGANDVVTRWVRDAAGNVPEERHYGGDTQPLATTASLCALVLPAETHFVRHTYASGSRASSQWQTAGGVGLGGAKFLDLTIDTSSGLPSASRDVAGVQTDLVYDTSGRLTWEKPTAGNGAWTSYAYTRATSASAMANVLITQRPNGSTTGSLAQSRVYFDPFGRVWRDQKLGYDGIWSTVDTVWNAMGWRRSTTERMVGSPGKFTIFKDFDPFGRPQTIQPPDGTAHNVTFTYAGTREVARTVKVKTGASETSSTTTERYDRQGRLYQVVEPSGAGGANTTTSYGYDVGGRLASVAMPGQSRTFSYDLRGFLAFERHPEKGASGNGYVRYLDYDALGNPGRKLDAVATAAGTTGAAVDVRFTYDRASRLTQISEATGSLRPLKVFTYATASSGTNKRAGKIELADRYNYVFIGTTPYTAQVRETYVYAGTGGRVSSRDTQTWVNGGAAEGFTQAWAYNDLGDVTTLTYPRCTHSGCNGAALTSRTVTFGYTNGWLTSVPNYAGSITYHPNGMANQVAHTNGVTYTQANDPNAMRRPASYATTGAAINWTSGAYAYDGAGNVTAIGANAYLYDPVSRLTSASQYTGTASGTGSLATQSAAYDVLGNLTSLTTNGSALTTTTSTATNRLSSAGYDAAGSMTSWNGNAYAYEPLGMSNRVSSSGVEYDHIYTADDERLWTYSPGNPSRFTVRDLDGKVLREFKWDNVSWVVERDYVHRDGVLLAAVLPTGAVNHFHPDHLGSPRLITGAGGAYVAYHLYHPYGAEATAFTQDTERMKFTGHERDLGLLTSPADDLDYMHARYYNMQVGRLLAFDPVGGNQREPHSWNRYTYVVGNPLKFVDPYGLFKGETPQDPFTGEIEVCVNAGTGEPCGAGSGQLLFLKEWASFRREFEARRNNSSLPGSHSFSSELSRALAANGGRPYSCDWGCQVMAEVVHDFESDPILKTIIAAGELELGLVAASALGDATGFQVNLIRYPNAGGGGMNVLKNGTRVFGLDWHRFKLNGQIVSRLHYHWGATKSQLAKHRPWQGGWR